MILQRKKKAGHKQKQIKKERKGIQGVETLLEEWIPQEEGWARVLKPPRKHKRHVVLDLCVPNGSYEKRTVPQSQGTRGGYRQALEAHWGDLWPYTPKPPPPPSARRDKWKHYKLKQKEKKLAQSKLPSQSSLEGKLAANDPMMEIFSEDLLLQQKGRRHDMRRNRILHHRKTLEEETKKKDQAKALGFGPGTSPKILSRSPRQVEKKKSRISTKYRTWEELNDPKSGLNEKEVQPIDRDEESHKFPRSGSDPPPNTASPSRATSASSSFKGRLHKASEDIRSQKKEDQRFKKTQKAELRRKKSNG